MKIIENHQQYVFLYTLFAPWQETFADAGDEVGNGCGGGGGGHLGPFQDHFNSILVYLWDHFGTPMTQQYVFKPKINFLEMAHTNFVSSIR